MHRNQLLMPFEHQSRFFRKGEDIEHASRLVHEKICDPKNESLRTNKNSSNTPISGQVIEGLILKQ